MQYKKFKELTVADYQQLYTVYRSEDDDTEKSIQFVAILTGLPRWQVEEISLADFNKVCREVAVIFSGIGTNPKFKPIVRLRNRKYLIRTNPRKISSGQYIDLQHFMKGNIIDNLHSLFACLLVPKKLIGAGKYKGEEHEIVSEEVRDLNFCYVHSTCIFFLTLWKKSMIAIRASLEKKAKKGKQSQIPQELLDLWKLTDGFITQSG